MKEEHIEVEGRVTVVLPGTMFRVELDNKHLSVKLKRCRKGTPPNTDWDQAWNEYKRWALANFVAHSR